METEITSELLETIYNRVNHVAIAKYGSEPNEIKLCGEYFEVVYSKYSYGEYEESEYVYPAELTMELDVLIEERKIKEEKERQERRIQQEKERIEREKRDKEARERKYLELKKEFEK